VISYIVGILLFGGFYDFSVSATAVCVVAEILAHYVKKKPVYRKKGNYILWIPSMAVGWSILVSLWALDMSENVLGIMRGVTLLLWMYRCFLMSEEEKRRCFSVTPHLGAGMVVVGLLSLLNEKTTSFFWQAERFGGIFQYSNTCALFLFVGIVVLVQQIQAQNKEIYKETGLFSKGIFNWPYMKKILVLAVLVLGIFLTGSRSVLLLLLVWGTYQALRVKRFRIPFVVVAGISLIFAYGYGIITGSSQNIARIFTLFSANSTILGRCLYYIDALSMAVKYPFGLGYMGYYYMQPVMQTGVYTTRFVHNDFIQLLVDYGFLALVAVLVYLGYQLIKGKQGRQKKELLILICVAALADFHLQYMSILMFFVLCLDLGEQNGLRKQKELRENYIFCGIGLAVSVYLTVAFGCHYMGKDDLALAMLPNYTQAQIEELTVCTDKERALLLADEILEHNVYVSEAYHSKVYAAAMSGDVEALKRYMDQSLAIRRYDVETYKAYDGLLADMIIACNEVGRMEEIAALEEYKNLLPQKLAGLEETTHPIAYKLRDVPVFTW